MNSPNITRGIILAASCLIIGFVAGWTLASSGGTTVELPEAQLDVTVEPSTPAGATTAPTDTSTAVEAPDPKTSQILILNASGVDGRAGDTQAVLVERGYSAVTSGNADPATGNAIYYAADARSVADVVSGELQITDLKDLAGSPYEGASSGAVVVVVLGT